MELHFARLLQVIHLSPYMSYNTGLPLTPLPPPQLAIILYTFLLFPGLKPKEVLPSLAAHAWHVNKAFVASRMVGSRPLKACTLCRLEGSLLWEPPS